MKAIKRFSVIIVVLLMVLSALTLPAGAVSTSDILKKSKAPKQVLPILEAVNAITASPLFLICAEYFRQDRRFI